MADDNRIHSLDSLRGISSFIVVIFHSLISLPVFYAAFYYQPYSNNIVRYLTETPLHILWAGPEAVLLFFILSGFVLSLPYIEGRAMPYRGYVIKRFFRIYIPYIVIMAAYTIILTTLANYNKIDSLSAAYNARWIHPVTMKTVFSYIFMTGYDVTNVNGVVWSLVHEMRISIIFPFIMIIVNRFNWLKALIYGIGLSLGISVILKGLVHFTQSGSLSFLLTSFSETAYYCIFFVLGATLAKYRKVLCARIRPLSLYSKAVFLIAAITLITFKWTFHSLYVYSFEKLSFYRGGLAGDWVAALGILTLFVVALSSTKAEDVLGKKLFVWLGNMSYSLYLLHVLVIMLSARYLSQIIPLKLSILIVPLITLPLAHLSYKYIELPAMNYGRKLAKMKK